MLTKVRQILHIGQGDIDDTLAVGLRPVDVVPFMVSAPVVPAASKDPLSASGDDSPRLADIDHASRPPSFLVLVGRPLRVTEASRPPTAFKVFTATGLQTARPFCARCCKTPRGYILYVLPPTVLPF